MRVGVSEEVSVSNQQALEDFSYEKGIKLSFLARQDLDQVYQA